MSRNGSRTGLTLLEVLVSLVVIGVALASARAIADQIAGAGRASSMALTLHLNTLARAEELRRVFALAIAPRDSTEVFDGDINDAALSTRCFDARGFEGACRCHVAVRHDDGRGSVVERSCDSGLRPDTLVADSLGVRLIYLVDAVGGGRWISEWRRTNSLPRAIGVIRNSLSDTLVVRIGERG